MQTPQLLAQEFVAFCIDCGALRFGSFVTKAGRLSPYFFNAGLFNDGYKITRLANFYAQSILSNKLDFDMIFGPAYKGIPLGVSVAMALHQMGKNVPFAYNRKEAKDHGEGGLLVGAPLQGKVLVIDDVMSAGTAMSESLALIEQENAQCTGLAIALDRQEMAAKDGKDLPYGAVDYVKTHLHIPVSTIATLDDILLFLQHSSNSELMRYYPEVVNYRQRYGTLMQAA